MKQTENRATREIAEKIKGDQRRQTDDSSSPQINPDYSRPGKSGQQKVLSIPISEAVNIDEDYARTMAERRSGHEREDAENEGSGSKIEHPFKVLGYNETDHILIYSDGILTHKTPNEVLQEGFIRLHYNLEEIYPPTSRSARSAPLHKQVSLAILADANRKGRIREEEELGAGVWKRNGAWLVVSGRKAIQIPKDGEAEELNTPIFDGRTIRQDKKEWVALDKVRELYNELRKAPVVQVKEDFRKDFEQLRNHFRQWSWGDKTSHETMSDYFVCWIILAVFQQGMSWRPLSYLAGSTASGKSSLLDSVETLLGPLAEKLNHTTAYAVSQSIGNTGKVLMIDEFEAKGGQRTRAKHMAEMLERAKIMSAGGVHSHGTLSEIPKRFELHHMPIFASINLPPAIRDDGALRNRFIIFIINKKEDRGGLKELKEEERENILARLVAYMLIFWPEIDEKALEMRNNASEIIAKNRGLNRPTNQRMVDNFAYMTTIYKIFRKDGRAVAEIPHWAMPNDKETSDEEAVLEAISTAVLKTREGGKTVCELVEEAEAMPKPSPKDKKLASRARATSCPRNVGVENWKAEQGERGAEMEAERRVEDAHKSLERYGIRILKHKELVCLAIRNTALKEHIFSKESPYKEQDVTTTLKRLRGVTCERKRIHTQHAVSCLLFPIEYFVEGEDEKEAEKG